MTEKEKAINEGISDYLDQLEYEKEDKTLQKAKEILTNASRNAEEEIKYIKEEVTEIINYLLGEVIFNEQLSKWHTKMILTNMADNCKF